MTDIPGTLWIESGGLLLRGMPVVVVLVVG